MRRWYSILRWIGYSAGCLGLILVLAGRNGLISPRLFGFGVLLLIIMALCFLVTYVIYVSARLQGR